MRSCDDWATVGGPTVGRGNVLDVGEAEQRRLFDFNLKQYIAAQLQRWQIIRDAHANDGNGVCKECKRPCETYGCEDFQEASGMVEHWRQQALQVMTKQPGDKLPNRR